VPSLLRAARPLGSRVLRSAYAERSTTTSPSRREAIGGSGVASRIALDSSVEYRAIFSTAEEPKGPPSSPSLPQPAASAAAAGASAAARGFSHGPRQVRGSFLIDRRSTSSSHIASPTSFAACGPMTAPISMFRTESFGRPINRECLNERPRLFSASGLVHAR
jgi:hypothetical protein